MSVHPALTAAEAREIDADAIARFNVDRNPLHVLHTRTGAAVPTSNLATAPVVLLLANPAYSPDLTVCPDGCDEWGRDGWPLASLHPDAPAGGYHWTRQRLRLLVDKFGAQYVAQRVAMVQLDPWASVKFPRSAVTKLPSSNRILSEVSAAGRRGALLVVLRCKAWWEPALAGSEFIECASPLSGYVSPGNFKDGGFQRVVERLR